MAAGSLASSNAARAMYIGVSALGSLMPLTILWYTVPGIATTCDGDSAVTAMLCSATSCARPCVSRSNAALVEPYMVPPFTGRASLNGARPGPIAEPDEIFTMAPRFNFIMPGSTNCDIMNGPCTLTANALTQCLTL